MNKLIYQETIIKSLNGPGEPIQGESFNLDIVEIDGEKYISYDQFKKYQDWRSKHEQH